LGSVIGGEKLTISADATLFKQGWSGSHQLQAGILLQPILAQRIALDYVNAGASREDRVLLDPQDLSKGTRIFTRKPSTHHTSSQRPQWLRRRVLSPGQLESDQIGDGQHRSPASP